MDDQKQFYETLKSKREEGNFSLEEISDFTKIDIKYLMAIEVGDFSCLPAVYMRLFLRSYCRYIGADAKKALNDFEFSTVGVKPKEQKTDTPKQEETGSMENQNEEGLNLGQIPTSKVITVIVTVLSLFLIFYVINNISKKNSDPDAASETSNQAAQNDLQSADVDSYSKLPNEMLLTNAEFVSQNVVLEDFRLLPDLPPYEFTIVPHTQTKINVTNDNRVTNKIVNKNEVLVFNVQDKISFDIWSANHVTCKLNGTELNTFFGSEEQSIRGTFLASEQRLFYKIYKQITY